MLESSVLIMYKVFNFNEQYLSGLSIHQFKTDLWTFIMFRWHSSK